MRMQVGTGTGMGMALWRGLEMVTKVGMVMHGDSDGDGNGDRDGDKSGDVDGNGDGDRAMVTPLPALPLQ